MTTMHVHNYCISGGRGRGKGEGGGEGGGGRGRGSCDDVHCELRHTMPSVQIPFCLQHFEKCPPAMVWTSQCIHVQRSHGQHMIHSTLALIASVSPNTTLIARLRLLKESTIGLMLRGVAAWLLGDNMYTSFS